jgi:type IV pilus assembly protein PilZ
MADVAERRGGERIAVDWQVDCETEDTFLFATITNISSMGIFVRTLAPLPIGTLLLLKFAPRLVSTVLGDGLREASELDRFELEGAVVWVNPARPSCPNPGMGVGFRGLSPEDRDRLVLVVRSIAYLPAEVDSA